MNRPSINVGSIRNFYFDELRHNDALRGAPVYALASYSCYMTDLLWSQLFSKKLGGKILKLYTTTGKSVTLAGFDDLPPTGKPETSADYLLRRVRSDYRYEDHGETELHDRFVAIRELRGGDSDVPTGLIYYFNPKSHIKYWLWVSVAHRRIYGDLTVWGNVASHFLNPWVAARLPQEEPLSQECKLTKDKAYQQIKRWRRPISLELVACDELNFLADDYTGLQQAIVKAHNSYAEDLIRSNLTPIVRGTEAETNLLFWRNEYYPAMPEMPRVYNVRRYMNMLELMR